ncbi:MAG: hydroxymethylglutaryl-CoA lyase, partial [Rhodospirillales bacterium]
MKRDIDVLVSEVGPRDGLQSIQTVFTTDGKMEWIRSEAAAGVPQMQVGSFVNPKLLPQMADSAEIVAQSILIDGLTVSALVPNMKGAVNGLAAGAHQIGVVMSVSEQHNQANIRRSVQESLDGFAEIVAYRNEHPEYK